MIETVSVDWTYDPNLNQIRHLKIAANGALWAVTASNRLVYAIREQVGTAYVVDTTLAADGTLWTATANGAWPAMLGDQNAVMWIQHTTADGLARNVGWVGLCRA